MLGHVMIIPGYIRLSQIKLGSFRLGQVKSFLK
jgi:hypothetical protein